jgi:hypothetical protein
MRWLPSSRLAISVSWWPSGHPGCANCLLEIPVSVVATMTEKLAESMLSVSAQRAISDLYDAADTASRLGKLEVAASLIEMAEMAERLWMGRARQPIERLIKQYGRKSGRPQPARIAGSRLPLAQLGVDL